MESHEQESISFFVSSLQKTYRVIFPRPISRTDTRNYVSGAYIVISDIVVRARYHAC